MIGNGSINSSIFYMCGVVNIRGMWCPMCSPVADATYTIVDHLTQLPCCFVILSCCFHIMSPSCCMTTSAVFSVPIETCYITCGVYGSSVICVIGPAKIYRVSAKKSLICVSSLLYHNLLTVHTNKTKSLSQLQNLMGFFLKFTEMKYHIQS